MTEKLRLAEFVSANPYMSESGWRQELVAGEVRVLGNRSEEIAERTLGLSAAFASCIRRAKIDARIEMGVGIGIEDPEGDHYRVADLVLALPDGKRRRRVPAVACLVVADADAPGAEAEERLAVFSRRPGLCDLLVFSAGAPLCRSRRRIGDGWFEERVEGIDATVRLASVPASLFLASAYADLDPGDGPAEA
ncbi:hypothetical protein [Arenibaculum pallidiluteum]|uniref:hypothetical protein n=1 Tax=Arenibaculum pallidiluteum TaxID=2812559 RepID=UPI001A9566BC|nr:hypothetical protein [Arenibaculum pallidiluteum]